MKRENETKQKGILAPISFVISHCDWKLNDSNKRQRWRLLFRGFNLQLEVGSKWQ